MSDRPKPIDLRAVDDPKRAEAEQLLADMLQRAKDEQEAAEEQRADEEGRCP